MTPLSQAIAQLQAVCDAGIAADHKFGTMEWYLLRANTLGLAYLKQVQARGLESQPRECENLYRTSHRVFKNVVLPDCAAEVPVLLQSAKPVVTGPSDNVVVA